MSDFTADADTLDNQGLLHSQMAQFYRNLADQVQSQGGKIVAEFERVQNTDYASQYQSWLNTLGSDQLQHEASLHDTWAQYFFDLAQQIREAENAFSNTPPGGRRGGPRFE
jgi:uncharacterized lipoprotein YddW (UPF0748 family)